MIPFSNLVKIINKSSLPYMLEYFCSVILEIVIHITWEQYGTLNRILSSGDIL